MLSDFKTSIDKILHERLISPFWGAFILSWFIWNWRIPYVSIFVDQDKLKEGTTRIDYIVNECLTTGWVNVLWLPLLSTAVIVLVFPFISNGAYWISLKFNKWKVDKKNQVEGATLLTLDQSIKLKEQVRNTEEKYDQLLNNKNKEIDKLKREREEYRNEVQDDNSVEGVIKRLYAKVSHDEIHEVFKNIENGYGYNIQRPSIERMINYGILEVGAPHNKKDGMYEFHLTDLGKEVKQLFYNRDF